MGFREINIYIRAHNEVSSGIRTIARDISVLGASASAVAQLGRQFGLFSNDVANSIMTVGNFVALTGTLIRGMGALAAVLNIAQGAQWSLTTAQAAGIALTGVGIGVLVAAAAATYAWAQSMRNATAAAKDYNNEIAKGSTRSAYTIGEEALRRGVEGP
jgi:hypothetical protein